MATCGKPSLNVDIIDTDCATDHVEGIPHTSSNSPGTWATVPAY